MAHSYLSVKNSSTERTVSVTDSILRVFMYFFNESVDENHLVDNQLEICRHYNLELAQVNTSFIDLKLQAIHENSTLVAWYTSVLARLAVSLESYNGLIDNNYLNELSKLKKADIRYTRPIEVSRLKNLINDIHWLLCKTEKPSGDFKWFENPTNA
jgi:hypothetical protein